jgi:hypothetical protein
LEGMACGKAVFVYDQFGGDGWVTAERYPAMEADNFAGQSRPPIATPAQLEDELERYSAPMGTVNRELAVTFHGARAHAHDLCALLEHVDAPADLSEAPLRELSRLVRLQWLTEQRALGFEEASRRAHAELDALRRRHEELAAHNRALAHELERFRALSRTRRVRLGLRLGEVADTARRTIRRR